MIREYVVLLKGWDHQHRGVETKAGDAARAESEIVADITEAAHYLGGLADATGQFSREDLCRVGQAQRPHPSSSKL